MAEIFILYTLKKILGHKDITATSRYLTITTAHKSKAMEIFEVLENDSNIIELVQIPAKRDHEKIDMCEK